MKRMNCNRIIMLAIVAVTTVFAIAGCSSSKESDEDFSLTVGLMPAVDAVPILLAEKKGYFAELDLKVELQMFSNAQDRQSALQAKTIDGAITDLIAVAANVDGGFDIKATTMTNGVFPVLMKEGAESKENIKVGMMEVSVTNFLIDEWLGDKYIIEKVYINDIPARLAAIGSGQLDMGLFPEPMASMGEQNGLEKVLYQPEEGFCPDVIVFTGEALAEKEEAIKRFHEAYNKAAYELNQNEQAGRDILMESISNLAPEIKDEIIIPEYTKVTIPDNEYIDKIIEWTSKTMEKDLKIKAEDLVERRFSGS